MGELVDLDSGKSLNGLDGKIERLSFEIWKDYHRAVALPKEFVEELSRTASLAHPVWVEAREKNDYSLFSLHLEKFIALKLKEISYLSSNNIPYDTLLDEYKPGVTTVDVQQYIQ